MPAVLEKLAPKDRWGNFQMLQQLVRVRAAMGELRGRPLTGCSGQGHTRQRGGCRMAGLRVMVGMMIGTTAALRCVFHALGSKLLQAGYMPAESVRCPKL